MVGGCAANLYKIKPLQPGFARGKTGQIHFARWKTIQPRFWREGKSAPPLVAGATTFPPAEPGALWVLSGVLHDTKDKRRAVYSAP